MKLIALFPVALALALAAAATAGDALALTLGRAQGIPLIGRPLEVSVPVTLDGASDPLPECVEADVFYGDTRLSRERVATNVQPASSGASVRVRAQVPVNEPVVTVYLQVGCGSRLSRRLVLFAEQPDPEADRLAEARAARPTLPYVAPLPAASAAVRAPGSPAASARRSRTEGTGGRAVPAQPRAVARAPASAPAAPAARNASRAARQGPAQGRTAPQARLKLEPLDLSVAVEPKLRMTDGMATPGPVNNEQRALAIALWKALNARPEDLLRDAQRLQALEDDLRGLRQQIQRNEAALVEMRGQVQQSQRERYANPLVYVLGLLALLGAAAAWWFWRRSRAPRPEWWSGTDPDALDSDRSLLRPDPRDKWEFAPATADAKAASRKRDADASSSSSSSASVSSAGESAPGSVAPARVPVPVAASAARSSSGFSQSLSGDFQGSQLGPRALKAEELHDVQQEADFFVSLGEYDRAVDLLRSHITANPQTSAVAWLDLMDIFHMLGRRMEYDDVRREFQGLFNAQVPEYDHYTEAMPGLEDSPAAIDRICALWPHPRVLEVIEESIFRGPARDGSKAFTLEAYRELLMLHHIGTEALLDVRDDDPVRLPSFTGGGPDERTGSGEAPPVFAATSISPLLSMPAGEPTYPTMRMDAPPGALPDAGADTLPEIGLDINLEDIAPDEPLIGASPEPGPAPGSDGHMLDFDLPEIDMSGFATKKTRE